ncbi:MAG: SDR family oxidoreductase [Candidatus Hermodarchaeota archaeon]
MKEINQYMNGKISLITGANSGIGKETAIELAKMDSTIIMVCRNQERGEVAREEIMRQSCNDKVDLLLADLSSQNSIRQLVTEFKEKYSQLHVLVNNAGLWMINRVLTVDGLETTFAVNYLGHFLLTNLLLDVIISSAPSRIINVSSWGEMFGTINFDDLQGEKKYGRMRAYIQSKLALIMFTYELARRLDGTGVTVNTLHPGFVRTNFFNKNTPRSLKVLTRLLFPLVINVKKGVRTVIYLASSQEVEKVTGKYFINCRERKSSKKSYDTLVQNRLWTISEELTGLK